MLVGSYSSIRSKLLKWSPSDHLSWTSYFTYSFALNYCRSAPLKIVILCFGIAVIRYLLSFYLRCNRPEGNMQIIADLHFKNALIRVGDSISIPVMQISITCVYGGSLNGHRASSEEASGRTHLPPWTLLEIVEVLNAAASKLILLDDKFSKGLVPWKFLVFFSREICFVWWITYKMSCFESEKKYEKMLG